MIHNDISVELKYVDSNGDQILDESFEEWATYSINTSYEKTKRFNVLNVKSIKPLDTTERSVEVTLKLNSLLDENENTWLSAELPTNVFDDFSLEGIEDFLFKMI